MTNYEYIRANYKELKKRRLLAAKIEWYYVWWQKYEALLFSGLEKPEAEKYMRKKLNRVMFWRIKKIMTDEC